jgi:ApaG protein
MAGTYLMETPEGDRFDIEVPAFSLDSPHFTAKLN